MKKIRHKINLFFKKVSESSIGIPLAVLIGISIIVLGLSLPYYMYDFNNFYPQILAEAHGMMFDIAVIGILIFWLNAQTDKKRRIRTYIDEIDDFRLWQSEEAAFRTAGNIKRLNRHKIYDLNLAECHMVRTNLNYVILRAANLNLANITHSNLISVDLEQARMNQTNFSYSTLNHGIMKNSYASGANFQGACLINTDMENTLLIKANFEDAILMESNLRNCDLDGANLLNCNLFKADLRGVKGLTIEQLLEAKSLYRAKFDDDIMRELQAQKPELLTK